MITGHALLPVISGMEDEFTAAFEQARPLISATEGHLGLQLSRSIETPNHFPFAGLPGIRRGAHRRLPRFGDPPRMETTAASLPRSVPGGRTLSGR
ncbi:antibiotic biosynthesis monooxygenase [Arthrobacter sp. AQ5-05]|uniref:antibiotic biosynthesis monooxygenase family protein n=1 Tax=Arthrobacter sp. AQ5-05 TaxID=2184581 RepID=UPI00336A4F1B